MRHYSIDSQSCPSYISQTEQQVLAQLGRNDLLSGTKAGHTKKEGRGNMTRKMLGMVAGVAIWTVFTAGGAAIAAGKGEVTYEKDVKKIVSENCLSCHGSDAPTMEAFKKDQEGFKKAMKGPRMDTYANL